MTSRLTPFSAPARIPKSGESEKSEEKCTVLVEATEKLSRYDEGGSAKPSAPSREKILKHEPEERKTPRKAERPALVTVVPLDFDGPGREIEPHPAYLLAHRKGRFHCEIFVRFDSPQGIKIRKNLEQKLKDATDRKYTISFKPTPDGTLSIRFVPHLLLQNVERSKEKLENVIKALVADQSISKADQSISKIDLRRIWYTGKRNHRINWILTGVDAKSPICKVGTDCITEYLFERCGSYYSKFYGNKVLDDDSTSVCGSFKLACLGKFDGMKFREELRQAIAMVCRNINWLVYKGFTADQISQLGGLADAKITSTKLLLYRSKLPRFSGAVMSASDRFEDQHFALIANLPSDGALANEIGYIAGRILSEALKKEYKVFVSKAFLMWFGIDAGGTQYKISWPDSKLPDLNIQFLIFQALPTSSENSCSRA